MRILALVPGGIGEQLLLFPTLASLKAQYPNAVIDVIVEPRAKAAYRVCSHVNEVLVFDFKDRNGLADYLNLLGIIRDREYEAALNLSRQWQLNLLLWLNGIPLRLGYQGEGAWFLSRAIRLQPNQYAALTYHDLLQGFDIQAPCPPLKITVPKEDIQWAEAEQKRLGLSESGYILIHGGASRLARLMGADNLYPVPQWHTVIDDIQRKQPNLSLLLLQGSEDEDWIASMRQNHTHLQVTQPSDIGKLAAMIAGANLMLCPDSAPLHLSVAVGTYTIALFGPTQAAQLIPPDQGRCLGLQSKTNRIADILPADILSKIWRG